MFTAAQIQEAHSKVRSGADFPAYINEIKAMGVTHYETYVEDGRINYHGANHTVSIPPKYELLMVADTPDIPRFKAELRAHQEGKTNYLEFIRMCAETGIEKWHVSTVNMTCIYYDGSGNEVLVEQIMG